jgi:hypothetical protein
VLDGGAGVDVLRGGDGDDLLLGGLGDDNVFGDDGNDIVRGFDGADTIDAGPGNDVVDGQNGNDRLSGGSGDDSLYGGDGIDTQVNETGTDVCRSVETPATCVVIVNPSEIAPTTLTVSGQGASSGVTVTLETNGGARPGDLAVTAVALDSSYQPLAAGPIVDIDLRAPAESFKSAVIRLPVNAAQPMGSVGVYTRRDASRPWTEVTEGVTADNAGHAFVVAAPHFSQWGTFAKPTTAMLAGLPRLDPRDTRCVSRIHADQVRVAVIADSSGSMMRFGTGNPVEPIIESIATELPTSNVLGYTFDSRPVVDLAEDPMTVGAFGSSLMAPALAQALDAMTPDTSTRLRVVVVVGDGSVDDSAASLQAVSVKAATASAAVNYLSFGPVDAKVAALVQSTGGAVYTVGTSSDATVTALVGRYFDPLVDTDADTLSDCEETAGVLAWDHVHHGLRDPRPTRATSLLGPPAVSGSDSDGDKARDDVELQDARTDPLIVKQSLIAARQVRWMAAEPTSEDSDSDGHGDFRELAYGADPLHADRGWEYLRFVGDIELNSRFGGLYDRARIEAFLAAAEFPAAPAGLSDSALFSYALFQASAYLDDVPHEFDKRGWFWDELTYALPDFLTGSAIPQSYFIRDLWENDNAARRLDRLRKDPTLPDRMFSMVKEMKKLLTIESAVVKIGDQLIVSVLLGGVTGKILAFDKLAVAKTAVQSATFKRVALLTNLGNVVCTVSDQCSPEVRTILEKAGVAFGAGLAAANYGELTPVSKFLNTRFVASGPNVSVEINALAEDGLGVANYERIENGLPPVADNGQPVVARTENGVTKELPDGAQSETLADDAMLPADATVDPVSAGKPRWTQKAEQGLLECSTGARSFSGDTQILMADGTRQRIDTIRAGDVVLAADPYTGE